MALIDSNKASFTVELEDANSEAIMTEEEAEEYINSFLAKHLSILYDEDSYAFRHSFEFDFASLSRELQKKLGGSNNIAAIERVASRLRNFIREFCKAYEKYAPVPGAKYKYSTGRYFHSSIIYFTTDEGSRTRALQKALTGTGSDEKIFGMDFVLRQLTMFEIFKRSKSGLENRIERLLGGITIENVANTEHSSKYGVYFYGWRNVERYGWKFKNGRTKAPYSPFQNALNEAKRKCNIRSNTTLVSESIHEDIQSDLSKGYV